MIFFEEKILFFSVMKQIIEDKDNLIKRIE
jgi:hypothetical protein